MKIWRSWTEILKKTLRVLKIRKSSETLKRSSGRAWKILQNKPFTSKIGVDTAESEPRKGLKMILVVIDETPTPPIRPPFRPANRPPPQAPTHSNPGRDVWNILLLGYHRVSSIYILHWISSLLAMLQKIREKEWNVYWLFQNHNTRDNNHQPNVFLNAR